MSAAVPVAFYAPLKAPDDPTPSGDRAMARLLLAALAQAGYGAELASRLRTFDGAGDPGRQAALRAAGEREAALLIAAFSALPATERPRVWFTYHVYYKAPDWTGPRVAAALGIPYVVAEGSRAPKRASGPWAIGHAGAEQALDAARLVFVMTASDRPCLSAARPADQRLVDLPPFVGASAGAAPSIHPREGDWPLRLLAVAMMRPGDKLASYRLLAEALDLLRDRPWQLTIVGDGPARREVEALFAPFGPRVHLAGRIDDAAMLGRLYATSDLLVWPAVNEAYGMVFLEAQAMGCPVVAGDEGGVASVVRHGETGVLTPARQAGAFAAALAGLIDDAGRRRRLGENARAFAHGERSLGRAAAIIGEALARLGVPA